ncbi:hypothetical protein BDW02DRAFT_508173 [Decorospora gaudefroyi]|uniref:Putative gamma-glutamylcyclotransferase n=1 Tax=Decorospora gaudefroyi TaxID=184978 RepID=A0A6A5KA44_9PLEO|nr:hypothetical protein BDW02DRAFT_508173 [Decorospora gaudefroyi]
MSHTIFVYGTLMAPPILHRVLWGPTHTTTQHPPAHASPITFRPALLPAHQRHRVKYADYPALIPCPATTSSVRGTLVHGLTDGDIWRLDVFEGNEYRRERVVVQVLRAGDNGNGNGEGFVEAGSASEEEIETQAYLWTAGTHRLEAQEWDFDAFVRDKMARWVGGSREADDGIQDVDDAVAALRDDLTGGRGVNEGEKDKEGKVLESAV